MIKASMIYSQIKFIRHITCHRVGLKGKWGMLPMLTLASLNDLIEFMSILNDK